MNHFVPFLSQMGGAMAPPMKDLPRWLLENSDFAVAPDWTDIVKQSVSHLSSCLAIKLFQSALVLYFDYLMELQQAV